MVWVEMRDQGMRLAIEAAGGIGALARGLGIRQPSVSGWSRVPAERVVAVENMTGISREQLRPDLYAPVADTARRQATTAACTEKTAAA